jgi:hypothetical protein
MKYNYEPFVLRRFADRRIFLVNPKMPFEFFADCFYAEQPFFLTFQLDDGRIATIPNPTVMPLQLLGNGYWPRDLFPTGWEYVTFKNGNYPVIVTAHPVAKYDEWFRKFERLVAAFCKETIAEFITTGGEFLPLEEEKFEKAPAHAM